MIVNNSELLINFSGLGDGVVCAFHSNLQKLIDVLATQAKFFPVIYTYLKLLLSITKEVEHITPLYELGMVTQF